MSIRKQYEAREEGFISSFGCRSAETKGRLKDEESCPIRTAFQVDRDRIVYSNAFRRLKHKTQVFLTPLGDEYRTRLTHTLEVAQISKTIARALRLNEDLADAIALGHDLGHTPFGHGGEIALKEIYSADFSHHEQSLRVVDLIENNGAGLNLTYEVRDGILKHSKGYGQIIPDDENELAGTIEGRVVRVADIMAYLNHDLDDAVRSRVIRAEQVPDFCSELIGRTHWERATTMINDLVFSSEVRDGKFVLQMTDDIYSAMTRLRKFLYENVYRAPRVHNEFVKAKKVLSELYHYFIENGDQLERELVNMDMADYNHTGPSINRIVCDFIASMTDRYALNLYRRIFFPSPMV